MSAIHQCSGKQIISYVIRLCGGDNIFTDLPAQAPRVISVEGFIAANPDAIITGGMRERTPHG